MLDAPSFALRTSEHDVPSKRSTIISRREGSRGRNFIKSYSLFLIFIVELYKNHYTGSWRPGGHLIFRNITSIFIKISTRLLVGTATLHSARSKCDRHSTTSSAPSEPSHRRLRSPHPWTPPTCKRCDGNGRGRQRRSASTHAPCCFQRRVLERVIFIKISP